MILEIDRPLFVHTGIRKTVLAMESWGYPLAKDVKASLFGFFASFAEGETDRLIFPAFNYDFGRTRKFDVQEDPVQVGSFPEFVRSHKSYVRSQIPFFSVLSKVDLGLLTSGVINPFGKESCFQTLVDADASLMFAGAPLHSITFIHYVEEMSGGPKYRYLKSFPGEIVSHGNERACDFAMHVRPMGVHMDYDWARLSEELQNEGIMRFSEKSKEIFFINTRELLEFWGNKLTDDPLYLLDAESLAHFGPATNAGSRRVSIEEYENV